MTYDEAMRHALCLMQRESMSAYDVRAIRKLIKTIDEQRYLIGQLSEQVTDMIESVDVMRDIVGRCH